MPRDISRIEVLNGRKRRLEGAERQVLSLLQIEDLAERMNFQVLHRNIGKMKIRGVMARKRDAPEYVHRMQKELFTVLGEARSREELQRIEPRAREVAGRYRDELAEADVGELAIHRRVGRLNYSRRRTEASAVQAYVKQGIPMGPRVEIGYVVRDAKRWEVDQRRSASGFDAGYYGKLLEKA